MSEDPGQRRDRRSVYALLILVTLALVAGRIATVTSREGDTAFLSANDRSRWCTVAALVEDGTYAIDRLLEIRGDRNRRPWYTIDLVRHRGPDGQLHYYSSKPPLFPTMVAGVYWVVHAVTGMTLTAQPIYMTRIVLALVNLPLYAIWLFSMVASIEALGGGRPGGSDWTRRFLVAAICFGTLLLPFAWSLSNHLPAAAASAAAMWIYLVAARRLRNAAPGEPAVPRWWWFGFAVAAAFAAANELPALSMLAFWSLLGGWLDRRSILPMLGGIGLVAAGFFGTNWIAHQSLRPPYAHRGVGAEIATVELTRPPAESAATVTQRLRQAEAIGPEETVAITPSSVTGRWIVTSDQERLFALLVDDDEAGSAVLAQWDDWYEYPRSYWRGAERKGVDRGEPSRGTYLLHATVGHHGVFSLTPLWLLVPWGWYLGFRDYPWGVRRLVLATSVATLVCFAFYLMRPEIDRNYGGVSIAFRWLIWMVPFWFLALVPAIRRLSASRLGRMVASLLLLWSVFSVSASLDGPWQHPWLYRFWLFLGWIAE